MNRIPALTVALACFVALGCLTAPGCESAEPASSETPTYVGPLPFDPTEEYELSEWWTNGQVMMRLRPTNQYMIYASMNRYEPPIQIGRWDQDSYAVIWLHPYTTRSPEPIRMRVRKIDDRIAVQLPGEAPMFGAAGPPRVAEDVVIGEWSDGVNRAKFFATLRYQWGRDTGDDIGDPVYGRWSVADDTVVILEPDENKAPIRTLELGEKDGAPYIENGERQMKRVLRPVEGN